MRLCVFTVGCGLGASFILAFSKQFMKPFHSSPLGMSLAACLFAAECGEQRPCFCGGGLLWLFGEGRGEREGENLILRVSANLPNLRVFCLFIYFLFVQPRAYV